MRTQILKWGSTLALRIPVALARAGGVEQGSEVDLVVEEGCLIAKPVDAKPIAGGESLSKLLSGVSEQNLHPEITTGTVVGRESW